MASRNDLHGWNIGLCAVYANAGLGPAVTVKAHLEGYPRVADAVILSTNVIHVFDLTAEAEIEEFSANPGDTWIISYNNYQRR